MEAADAPRRRSDLQFTLRSESGRTYLFIEDLATGHFFRVREVEGFLLQHMDGSRTLEELHAETAREFPGVLLSLEAVVKFAQRLEKLGFFVGGPPPRRKLFGATRRWSIRIPLLETERLFTRLLPLVRWLYRPVPLVFCGLLVLLALYEGLGSWDQWLYHLHSNSTWAEIAVYFLGFTLLSVFHEFGHGLTCRYFGASARDVGIMFLYGIPGFYCNISGSYHLSSRRQRVLIGLAGIGWGFVVGAAAFLIWRTLEPTALGARVLHAMVGFAGVTALFNLIPFIRLDGYYVLSDLLNIPNLRRRSLAYLSARTWRCLLGGRRRTVGTTARERRIFFWFGLASFLYTAVLLTSICLLVGGRLTHHLGGTGALLWVLLLVLLFWKRLRRGFNAIVRQLSSQRDTTMQPPPAGPDPPVAPAPGPEQPAEEAVKPNRPNVRPYLTLAALIGVVAFLAFAPGTLTVSSPLELEATERVAVRPRTAGVLAELRYREGDRVPEGALVGRLETFDLEQQRQQIQAQLQSARLEGEIVTRSLPVISAQQEREILDAGQEQRQAEETLSDREALFPARRAEAERKVQEARAALDSAERVAERLRAEERRLAAGQLPPRMQAIEDRLGKVQVDLEFARQEINRVEYLVSEGAVERRRLDVARAALDSFHQEEAALRSELAHERQQLEEGREDAEAEVRRLRAAYEAALETQRVVESETRPERVERARQEVEERSQAVRVTTTLRDAVDVRQAETQLHALDAQRAGVQLARLERRIADASIYAPATGILTTPRVEERLGQHFDEGEEICWLDLVDRLTARLMVDEKEIGEVRVGQRVQLRLSAFPTRWFDAEVEEIAPRAEEFENRQAYEVRVSLPNPEQELRPGMTGFAKIHADRRPLREVMFRRVARWFRTEVWSWF